MNTDSTKLLYHLSALAQEHYHLCSTLYMLEVIRQKVEGRGYQAFDRGDIMSELGKIQSQLNAMHGKLTAIADTLKAL